MSIFVIVTSDDEGNAGVETVCSTIELARKRMLEAAQDWAKEYLEENSELDNDDVVVITSGTRIVRVNVCQDTAMEFSIVNAVIES